jgi:RNA polymerase sigma-70 factor (ECF subfamily)
MNSIQSHMTILPLLNRETPDRDEELLRAAKAGSHIAFQELQQTYSHRLYKRILSMTGNREDAEDALQETFFRAYRALPSFEERARFSTWLTRIAINLALMTIRNRRARPETSFEQQPTLEGDGACFEVPDHALNREQVCYQNQRSRAIRSAIQRLNPKLRDSIGIWISQEHSMKDLAQHLGISLTSAKSRVHRARKQLTRSQAFRNHCKSL